MPFFARHLPSARVTCLDVSKKSLEMGAALHPGRAEFAHFDGASIPYGEETFDIALASCVFHHIPHSEHVALLTEIRRVLKPDGLLFVFEHNPLNPLTRHAVNTCPFDENAHLIGAPTMHRRVLAAGFADAQVKYRIFSRRPCRACARSSRGSPGCRSARSITFSRGSDSTRRGRGYRAPGTFPPLSVTPMSRLSVANHGERDAVAELMNVERCKQNRPSLDRPVVDGDDHVAERDTAKPVPTKAAPGKPVPKKDIRENANRRGAYVLGQEAGCSW